VNGAEGAVAFAQIGFFPSGQPEGVV